MNKMLRKKRGPTGLFLMAVLGFVMVSAAPAGALPPEDGIGAGSGGFTTFNSDTAPSFPPLCVRVSADFSDPVSPNSAVLELWSEGTYTATDSSQTPATATYIGPTHATFTTTKDFYFNPLGVFSDSNCTTAASISGSLVIDEISTALASTSGEVSCSGDAVYTRVLEVSTIVATGMSCTVKNTNVGVLNNGTHTRTSSSDHTFIGAQQPCLPPFGLPCVLQETPPGSNFFVGTEWVGTYAQNLGV